MTSFESSNNNDLLGIGMFNYDNLKLVDKPNCRRNAGRLPQTLEGCEGYLTCLPLRRPNVDQKNPKTVADMVNILTDPNAATIFSSVLAETKTETGTTASKKGQSVRNAMSDGELAEMYSYDRSEMTSMLKEASKRICHTKAPFTTGHIVRPGCLSFYKMDGKTFAVPPGRWLLMSVKATWIAKNISLDQSIIQLQGSEVLILRVPPGSVGRILDQGVEILLGVGTHVFNSGTVTNLPTAAYSTSTHIQHGRYNYVRVDRGSFARVWAEVRSDDSTKSVQPRLLREGEHYIDSYLFSYKGLSKVSDEYIEHGSIHRVNVRKGFVAKVFHDNAPRLLGEGDHVVESTQFSYAGMQNITQNACVSHGTITVFRVTLGQIGLAWKDSEPTFFDRPGLFEFDSPDFLFVEFRNAEEPLIQLGAKKIVIVHTGQVGVTYDEGQLKILKSGRHIIHHASHLFHRFLSTQQKSIRLSTLHADEKMARKFKAPSMKSKESEGLKGFSEKSGSLDKDSDLTICETKDLVKVGLRADVFYSIEDPEKCIQKIDTDELEDLVRETAIATLTNIIRSSALNEIAQSKKISAGRPSTETKLLLDGDDAAPGSSTVFFEKVHDEFLDKLHEDFLDRYGVDIANIRIESFKIMDSELSYQISNYALTTAQIENEMANLEGKSLISTTQERTAADVKNIAATADAVAQKTIADAANQRKIDAARAEAEAHLIAVRAKAEAEAGAILVKARAEAEAIELKAQAEATRAELLSRTGLGQQQALLSLYSEMVRDSNRGVEKVIYLDPTVNKNSPFALGSLDGLNRDLHSLTQIGLAAQETNHNNN